MLNVLNWVCGASCSIQKRTEAFFIQFIFVDNYVGMTHNIDDNNRLNELRSNNNVIII